MCIRDSPKEVRFSIQQNDTEDYLRAAYMINNSAVDLVILQHEYGIFGGSDGALVIKFAAHLKKPFILVTHTCLLYTSFFRPVAPFCLRTHPKNWLNEYINWNMNIIRR